MDVDRLRPGAVPLAPETVLWFEFLLNPDLLESHLNKPNPDPSPVDLISTFLNIDAKAQVVTIDVENGENETPFTPKQSKRSLALKTLALKTAAFLNWDLSVIETKLPLPLQVKLLHDLLNFVEKDDVNIARHSSLDFDKCEGHLVFGVLLHHRWVVRSVLSSALTNRQTRQHFIPPPGIPDPVTIANTQADDIRTQLEIQVIESLNILLKIIEQVNEFVIPTFHTFPNVTQTDIEIKWELGSKVRGEDIKCQVHYELGNYYFLREEYKEATKHFTRCYELYTARGKLPPAVDYCLFTSNLLEQYCKALNIPTHSSNNLSLISKFHSSLINQYTGIFQILESDNLLQEIPLVDRDLLETEIQTAVCSGTFTVAKDFLLRIQILNRLRRAVVRATPNSDLFLLVKMSGDKGIEILVQALKPLTENLSEDQRDNLKFFLLDGMLLDLNNTETPDMFTTKLLSLQWFTQMFNQRELDIIQKQRNGQQVGMSFTFKDEPSLQLILRSPRLEVKKIEQELVKSYKINDIKQLIQKLCSKDPTKPWWKLNNKWDLPIPLQSVVMSLPKGYVIDVVYIFLAKAKELAFNQDFKGSVCLLEAASAELKDLQGVSSNALFKLERLIEWEVLLVRINEYLEHYSSREVDLSQLAIECKNVINISISGDSVLLPRTEVLEHCALALLNLGEWELLTSVDKRWMYLELAAAVAAASQDIIMYKGTKKITRDAWDLILPVFGPIQTNKRNNMGSTASPSNSILTKTILVNFLTKLRDVTCLSVVVSLLARLHNVLRDEPSLEVNAEYIALWPAVVCNSNSYSARSVTEVLLLVLDQGLRFMPHHIPWLKVVGDISYVCSDWSSSLRYYLEAASVVSDYYSQPIPSQAIEDLVYKRMIKCCMQLHCHTQAAVLCQFLEEVDYTTAFKCLSDTKSSHCADAMDAYYPCIWDSTILEFLVTMHGKRGEGQRKNQVIKIIGLLELNGNNNEEIQREATNIRRRKFLRGLTKQYSLSSQTNSWLTTAVK